MDVSTLFTHASKTIAAQPSAVAKLAKLLASQPVAAKSEYLACIDRILLGKEEAALLDRLLAFVSKTAAAHPALIEPTLQHLAGRLDCKNRLIRQRSARIIGCLLEALPAEAAVSDALWQGEHAAAKAITLR
jgi:hypothetical protein